MAEQIASLLAMGGILALIGWAFLKKINAEEAKRDAAWRKTREAERVAFAEWARTYEDALRALNTLTTCDTDVLGCGKGES